MPLYGVIILTGRQLKMARTGLGWTREMLARKAKVSAATVKLWESKPGRLSARYDTLQRIVAVLERAGVKFGTNEGVSFLSS